MGFSNNDKKRNYAKIELTKLKQVDPRFVLYQGKEQEPIEFTNYQGRLTGIKFDDYEWNGDLVEQVIFIFTEDDGTETWIKTGYTGVMRSIVNSLADKDLGGIVSFSLYSKTKNDKERAYVHVEIDGFRADWKYEIDEMPEMEQKTVNRKKVWDSVKLDEFIKKVIQEEIIPNIKEFTPELSSEPKENEDESLVDQVRKEKKERKASEKTTQPDDSEDDLPF